MFTGIMFDPVISVPLIMGIGLVIAVVTVVNYSISTRGLGPIRKVLLGAMRLTVLGLVICILLRPMALQPQEEVLEKPTFTVLTDCSQSMNTEDVGSKSRYGAMIETLADSKSDIVDRLSEEYRVKLYSFDKELRRTSRSELVSGEKAEGSETRIADALLNSIKADGGRKQVGVLVISDGRDNSTDGLSSVRSAARHMRAMNVPVWTVPVGTAFEAKDLYVLAKLSSSFVFVDQPASINVSVVGTGYDSWYARVDLYRENEYVTSEQVHLKNGHASVKFPIREDKRGNVQYRVEVEPLAGESDSANNKRSVIAKIIDEKTRVLVIEARPHWDSKFLLRRLRADSNIEVTSIFYINPNKTFAIVDEFSEGGGLEKTATPGVRMPRTLDELFKYDCIFLGRDVDTVFTTDELKLLSSYLTERGGGVVFYRGQAYSEENSAIAAIEPVQWGPARLEDARLELTGQGRSSPIFDFRPHSEDSDVIIRELPSMTSVTRVTDEKSLAVVLAKSKTGVSEEMAAVVYQRYGKGKVMSIGATGLWQWSFLPEDLREYDDIYQRFWGQMIRWLISDSDFLPGKDISFVIDRDTYSPGDEVLMSVSAKLIDHSKYKPWIELVGPDGETVKVTAEQQKDNPRVYKARFSPTSQGEYSATLHNNIGKPETEESRFVVYHNSMELRHVSADRELMEQLSSITGGEMLELKALGGLPDKVRVFEELTCERVKPHDVWDQLWIYVVLVSVLGLEWLIRRASALV